MKAIDLFAGLGGWTEGARLAGVRVVWAANHWRPAVETHQANHPETVHACQDLQQADWSRVPAHDLLLSSPACQGHCHARGKERAHHDASRSTAWAVVACVEHHRPPVVVVENVQEMRDWLLFGVWLSAFHRLGYTESILLTDAADHGVPQHRERLFIVLTRSRVPLRLKLPKRDYVAVASVLEKMPPGTPVRSLCANTRRRWREGQRVHGEQFLVAYYGSERGGRSLARPCGTVTTRDRYGLVNGDRLRMFTALEYKRVMGFREDYLLPPQRNLSIHLLGNAVPPVVAADVLDAIKEAA